jgi:2-dehydro-3-deoxygalactonokinase
VTQFFSCDWGTTSFRLRRIDAGTGSILAERREPCGVKALFSSCPAGDVAGREQVFAEFLRGQLRLLAPGETRFDGPTPVAISGMASSSVGWRELPYARVPADLDGTTLVQDSFELRVGEQWLARVHLISGLCTDSEIMRGEEAELVGLFTNNCYAAVAKDGWVVLPGTHSKHVRLQEGRITGFCTYMTGELFDVLSQHSLLKASVETAGETGAAPLTAPGSLEAFLEGVRCASSRGLASGLFQTRVRTVLQSVQASVNRWFLSGLLIGAEASDLARHGQELPILIAAAEPLSLAYRTALETLGLGDRLAVVAPAEMALALVRGHARLLECPAARHTHPPCS